MWQIVVTFTGDAPFETANASFDQLVEAAEGMGLNLEAGVLEPWPVRKARIGWWVNDRWCPTKAIRDHELLKAA